MYTEHVALVLLAERGFFSWAHPCMGLLGGWEACSMKLVTTLLENIYKPLDYNNNIPPPPQKKTHSVSDISWSEDEQKHKLESNCFPEYIIMESKETPVTSLSPPSLLKRYSLQTSLLTWWRN